MFTRNAPKIAAKLEEDASVIVSDELISLFGIVLKNRLRGERPDAKSRLPSILELLDISNETINTVFDTVGSYGIILATIGELINVDKFLLAWTERRFSDNYISLLVALSSVFRLTFVFDNSGSIWLLGEFASSAEKRNKLLTLFSKMTPKQIPISPDTILKDSYYISIIRSLVAQASRLYE
jgi:hypothetical protein